MKLYLSLYLDQNKVMYMAFFYYSKLLYQHLSNWHLLLYWTRNHLPHNNGRV